MMQEEHVTKHWRKLIERCIQGSSRMLDAEGFLKRPLPKYYEVLSLDEETRKLVALALVFATSNQEALPDGSSLDGKFLAELWNWYEKMHPTLIYCEEAE